jgi:predicted amidohydrolase
LTNYAAPQENGHSAAFSPEAYNDKGTPQDLLVVQAGMDEGIILAAFDLDRLRAYRQREVWGNAYRRPECYSVITAPK